MDMTKQQTPRAIVVLGAPTTKEGRPGLDMKQRLDRCLELLAEEKLEAQSPTRRSIVVVTGGNAQTYGSSGAYNEGDCMYNYLVENGVEGSRILVENHALHTFHNALYSKNLLRVHGYIQPNMEKAMDLVVLTTDWHMQRSMLCFLAVFGDQPKITLVPERVKSDTNAPGVKQRIEAEKMIPYEWVLRCIEHEKQHPDMPDPLIARMALEALNFL